MTEKEQQKLREEIENIPQFEAIYKENNKRYKIKEMDWFCNSGCTKKQPSWIRAERLVLDEDGEYCRTDEIEDSSDQFIILNNNQLQSDIAKQQEEIKKRNYQYGQLANKYKEQQEKFKHFLKEVEKDIDEEIGGSYVSKRFVFEKINEKAKGILGEEI